MADQRLSVDITARLDDIMTLGIFAVGLGRVTGYRHAHDPITRLCERAHAYSVEFATLEGIPVRLDVEDSIAIAEMFVFASLVNPDWEYTFPELREFVAEMADCAMISSEAMKMDRENAERNAA